MDASRIAFVTSERSNMIPADLVYERADGGVRLEPMAIDHAAELFAALDDAELWRLRPDRRPTHTGETRDYIAKRLADVAAGHRRPLVLRLVQSGEIVGTTGFLEIDEAAKSLEIGATQISPRWQRTFVNTECKLVLMTFAFEQWRANRVQFKVDTRNERSMRAVERLGAVREGTLRKNRVCWDGYIRDTAVYSVVAAEWPGVKSRLVSFLNR